MLLLRRRTGESIVIGDAIRVTVAEVRGSTVRLAIEAPGLPVYRAELLASLSQENTRALSSDERPTPGLAGPAVSFPLGIPGMGAHRDFLLFEVDDDLRALVAKDDPTLCLLLVDPTRVDAQFPVAKAMQRYPFEPEELAVAAVLTRPAHGGEVTVNLAAPMVFGVSSGRGAQIFLDDTKLSLRTPWNPAPVKGARTE